MTGRKVTKMTGWRKREGGYVLYKKDKGTRERKSALTKEGKIYVIRTKGTKRRTNMLNTGVIKGTNGENSIEMKWHKKKEEKGWQANGGGYRQRYGGNATTSAITILCFHQYLWQLDRGRDCISVLSSHILQYSVFNQFLLPFVCGSPLVAEESPALSIPWWRWQLFPVEIPKKIIKNLNNRQQESWLGGDFRRFLLQLTI